MKTVQVRNITLGQGIPKIAVPLVDTDREALIKQARTVAALKPDVVEWRIDFYQDVTDYDKLGQTATAIREVLGDIALLMTFRTKGEGGNLTLADDQYFQLCQAIAKGKMADLLDVELEHDRQEIKQVLDLAHRNGLKTIMSNHDFDKTPSETDIFSRLKEMAELGSDVAKLAAMPNNVTDVLTLLTATNRAQEELDIPVITMSMGDLGKVSRVAGQVFGSALTFGAVGKTSAPGQISLEDLRHDMADLKLN